MKKLILSSLPKTWLIDIDGVIFKHNSYLECGKDIIIPAVKILFNKIPSSDKIILLTSRDKKYEKFTINSLKKHKIRFDQIIFGLPKGERILINDIKPKGLNTAIAINVKRNNIAKTKIKIDQKL